MEVGSVGAASWCRSVRVGLVVHTVECNVVVYCNGWAIVEDVVDVVLLVELWIGGLNSNSCIIEKVVLVCIFSWKLASESGPRRPVSYSPPLSEIMSFCKRLFRVSLST